MPINRQQAESSGLAFILAIAAVGMAFLGIGIGSNACTKINSRCPAQNCFFDSVNKFGCQTGELRYRFSSGTITVFQTIAFPKPFKSIPSTVYGWFDNQSDAGVVTNSYGVGYSLSFTSDSNNSIGNIWRNMPAATTELFGNSNGEGLIDMTSGTQDCNLVVNVIIAGAAGSFLKAQFLGGDSVWHDLLPAQDVPISSTGLQVNGNLDVEGYSQVFGGVLVRIVGYGGNGIVSPSFGLIQLFCTSETTQTPSIYIDARSVTTTQFTMGVGFGKIPCVNINVVNGCANISGFPQVGGGYTVKWTAVS